MCFVVFVCLFLRFDLCFCVGINWILVVWVAWVLLPTCFSVGLRSVWIVFEVCLKWFRLMRSDFDYGFDFFKVVCLV